MPGYLEVLGQPLFLISAVALVRAGTWAYFYLRRGAASPGADSPPVPPVQRIPVTAQAVVAPLPPAQLPEVDPAVPGVTFADVAGLDEAVEETVFGDPTTGAEDDLARATALAEKMVRDFGMSRSVGLRSVAAGSDVDRAGVEVARTAMTRQIDDEVGRLIDDAHSRAVAIVTDHRPCLDRLADRLIVAETLDKDEIDRLLEDVPRRRSTTEADGSQATGALRQRQPKRRILDTARATSTGPS